MSPPRLLGITQGGPQVGERIRGALQAGIAVLVRESRLPEGLLNLGAGGYPPPSRPPPGGDLRGRGRSLAAHGASPPFGGRDLPTLAAQGPFGPNRGSVPATPPGLSRSWNALLVLHARMEDAEALARAHGLGLHLPGHASPAREDVRALRERHAGLLGASTHAPQEALAALEAGADYVLLSPIWAPGSKPQDTRPPLGPRVFEALRGLPVLALGGLTPERLQQALAYGAWGGAAMGGLFPEAPAPESPGAWSARRAAWSLPPAA